MPDLTNFSITQNAPAQITCPSATIEARVVDSTTSELLADFTGPNAIQFPSVLTSLSPPQRLELVNMVCSFIIFSKAGVS